VFSEEGSESSRRQFLRVVLCSSVPALSGCVFDDGTSAQAEQGSLPPQPTLKTFEPTESTTEERTERTTTETERVTTTTTEPRLPAMAEEYETALNVVDAGVDPSGETPIREVLDPQMSEDSLLYFPEGEYRMDGHWDLSRLKRLAVVGDNARIVPTEGYTATLFYTGESGDTNSVYVSGLTFDFSNAKTGARPLNLVVRDELVIEDVTVEGSTRSTRFDVTSPEGHGEIRRLELPDGGQPGEYAVGCLVGPHNRGEVLFEDCTIEGFPNNGLYASPSEGPVTVRGGTFRNNGIANVRVSGPSTVSDATVECTRAPQGFENMRGIWLRGGQCDVENCRVNMTDVTFSDGGIVGALSGEIRDCWVHVDASEVTAISIKPPRGRGTDGEHGATCKRVDVTGSASGETTVLVSDRDACVFEDLSIRQTGADRQGVHFIRSDGSAVRNATIEVTGAPLRFEESAVETVDVETSLLSQQSIDTAENR